MFEGWPRMIQSPNRSLAAPVIGRSINATPILRDRVHHGLLRRCDKSIVTHGPMVNYKHPWMLLIHTYTSINVDEQRVKSATMGVCIFGIYSLKVPDPIPLCMTATNINHPKLGDADRKWMWVGGTLFCFSPWIADDRCKL